MAPPADLLARIRAVVATEATPPNSVPKIPGNNLDGDTGGAWTPPEGLYTKQGEEIAQTLCKGSTSKAQAVARLAHYGRKAGKNLSADQVHNLKHARALIMKSQLADESFDLDESASFFPDVAAVIMASAYHQSHLYSCHAAGEERQAVDQGRYLAADMMSVTIWCPEFLEYRCGPLDDIDVLACGSSAFEIVAAYDNGVITDIQASDLLSRDLNYLEPDDAIGASSFADADADDADLDDFVFDPDGDGDHDGSAAGDWDQDLFKPTDEAKLTYLGFTPTAARRLSLAGIIARARTSGSIGTPVAASPSNPPNTNPATAGRRMSLHRKAAWLRKHKRAFADYNARFARARRQAGGTTEAAVLSTDPAILASIEELAVKRRDFSSRLSAERKLRQTKDAPRRKAAQRIKNWKTKNRHHMQRYKSQYADPSRKMPGAKHESLLARIAEHVPGPKAAPAAVPPRFSEVGDVRMTPGFGGDSKETITAQREVGDGYLVRTVSWTCEGSDKPYDTTYVINPAGHYIGDEKLFRFLRAKGIAPEVAHAHERVCSIGWSEKDGRYYGWSHRAIKGFKIGDKAVTFSPLETVEGAVITNKEQARVAAVAFADSVS